MNDCACGHDVGFMVIFITGESILKVGGHREVDRGATKNSIAPGKL